MAGAYDRDTPPDLKKNTEAAKAAASKTSPDSYEVKIKLPLTRAAKVFSFWFTYLYENPETKIVTEGPRSPTVQHGFDVPNLTKPVLNLTLTAGFKSYGVKFDVDPTSVQEDVVIFESLTGAFAGEQYIVYVGTSTNITINTSDFAPRWVRVRVRDKWLTANNSEATAGPVTPRNADPDTSTPPSAPQSALVTGSIDSNDKSGFSAKLTASWTANSDNNTSGYVIRWTTQNPATTPNPLWEYGQVDGKATTTFDITGLIPNTLYYWQVTAKSPYNALTWIGAQSGTVGPIVDPNAPADAFAQLRSIISIGGKTADLFKIGTGISQSINTSTTITPSQTSGNYSGIILNKSTTNFGHNYWLNTGQFRVGSPTNFLYWDGSDLYTTGKINATGGSFSGDVQISTGSLYAGAQPNTGARVRLNSAGLFAYDTNNNQTVAITQADGKIDARQGFIAGWTINVPSGQTFGTISRNATIFDSNGNITLGDTTGTLPSIVRLSATDSTYRLWVGSQSPSTAAFKVDSNGKLYATGAVIDGTASIAGTVTIGGTTASTVVSNASTAVSTANTASSNASTALANAQTAATEANTAKVAAAAAKAIADAALPSTSFNRDAIVNSINSTTTTTTINGGKITTGTISANAVVSDFISAFSINADKITTGTISGVTGNFTSGRVGGFDLGTGDLTGRLSVLPRIIFGTKVLIGWNGGSDYTISAGNPYTDTGQSFFINTQTNVFRFAADSASRAYAAEIRNDVRARDFRYIRALVNDSSSRRFKENITYAPKSYYDKILNITPAFYTYINNHPETDSALWGTHAFGPIAEDLEDAGLGLFVQRNLNGEPTALQNEHKLALLLIPIIRDLKETIQTMDQRILELENKNV